ncbi:MAG: threonine aldolase family protein [Alphaproteobacteria bacterium]
MILASDNWVGASQTVMAAVNAVATGAAPAYGADDLTKAVEAQFCDLFEREVAVFMVATGTAANALGITAYGDAGGVVFCHRGSHIEIDEAGAIAFFGGGMTTATVEGWAGKLSPDALSKAVSAYGREFIRKGRPVAVSLGQLTEWGAAYRPEEISALSEVARAHDLAVHMDGARFAGAAAATGCSPADLTWRSGVDVLSFGGTKNGCLLAEAVVFFDPEKARHFSYARLRAGHGLSKNWFPAAQFQAYLRDDHWLSLARTANAAGARLASILEDTDGAGLALQPDANEVFALITTAQEQRLKTAGVQFYDWHGDPSAATPPGDDQLCVRLITNFRTSKAELDGFARALRGD